MNIELIKTTLAIFLKGLLDFSQIHEILLAFDTKCKELDTDMLPLDENVINNSLRSIGLILPTSFFYMWCKKCAHYLHCTVYNAEMKKKKKTQCKESRLEAASGSKAVSRAAVTNSTGHAHNVSGLCSSEFKDFAVYPFEYLSLVCNAKHRVVVLNNAFRPKLSIEKTTSHVSAGQSGKAVGRSKGSKNQFLYSFTFKLDRGEV